MSELVWIAVPGGRRGIAEGGAARLSVVIMPILTGTSLAKTGMEDWPPAGLVGAALSVELRSDSNQPATPLFVPVIAAGQPGLWRSFFAPDTPIEVAAEGAGTTPQVQVEPTSQTAAAVKRTYEACAQAGITAESHGDLQAVLRTQLEANWMGEGTTPPSPQPVLTESQTLGFGTIYALLREHPAVLRALGLILDLDLPASATIPAEGGVVSVSWPGSPQPPLLPTISSPWSQFGREFLPGSTTNISSGMVTFTDDRAAGRAGPERWNTATVDVQGAAERFRSTARALVSAEGTAALPGASEVLPPALRSGGIQLLRMNRSQDFSERSRASQAFRERNALTADDLCLGYRVDIKLFGQRSWFSLQCRRSTYSLGTQLIGAAEMEEEAQLKPHAALDHGGGQIRADEVVARWNGWSMAVPLPNFVAVETPPAGSGHVQLPFDFRSTYSVSPGSLPPLRFGQQYLLRARAADLAGGGLHLTDPAADRCTTDPVSYRRHDPVLSPAIVLPETASETSFGPGESELLVVMRSEGGPTGGSAADFAQQHPDYAVHLRRQLRPPEASLGIAEWHGKLDGQTPATTFGWLQQALGQSTAAGGRLPDPAAGGVCAFPIQEPGGVLAERADCTWAEAWPDLLPKFVELREEIDSTEPRLGWTQEPGMGDLLAVSLGKGEQVLMEFSTFLAPHLLDRFALAGVPGLPVTSGDLAEQGRHPMVTPARAVRFVHAVRCPLLAPQGLLTASRAEGQTFVDLGPEPATLGINVNSTAQLQIAATWQERDDDQAPRTVSALVQTVGIDLGANTLREDLRHEFGDTRYRSVRYTATAVSRFRHFFTKAEAPEAFLLSGSLAAPLDILSSGRPAPLVVLSTRPAFRWEEQREADAGSPRIRRTRRSSLLRVELARPWFQTGDGELVAVLTSTDGRPPSEAGGFLTEVGRDPIWNSEAPLRWPTPETLTETAGPGASALLPELGEAVDLALYQPWFGGQSWFIDVALPSVAESSYCPIVQLAVCRYQPNSLLSDQVGAEVDLRLSSAVRTEFVSIFPERQLTLSRTGGELQILLAGLGPLGARTNRVDALLESIEMPPGVPAGAAELTAFTPDPSGVKAWIAVLGQVQSGSLGAPIRLSLPASAGSFRVRIREVELIGAADDAAAPMPGTSTELNERVVFTDTIQVPEE